MDEKEEYPEPGAELTRFQQLARALFRVDKKDVPKHEPKKRSIGTTRTDDKVRD